MATEFILPDLGENIQSGDVVSVLVSAGDTISKDDPVLELETDKATIEVPSSVSGKITAIHVSAGDTVEVGQVILTTEEEGAVAETAADEPQAPAQAEAAAEPDSAATEAPPDQPPPAGETETVEFKVPDLGENIESGQVVSVLVTAGDEIEEGQGVLELETDKATLEVPSSVSGVVKAVHISEGETASVGQLILTVETTGAAPPPAPAKEEAEAPAQAPAPAAEAEAAAPAEPQTVEFKVPDLGENIESGQVVSVLVTAGDEIEEGQGVLELETDKATLEVPSSVSGTVKAVHISEGETASVGQLILTVETTGAAPPPAPAKEEKQPEPPPERKPEPTPAPAAEPPSAEKPTVSAPSDSQVEAIAAKFAKTPFLDLPIRGERTKVPAAPNVRRIARELGVDITTVEGSGPGGRVLMDDVKRHANRLLRAIRVGIPLGGNGAGRPVQSLPDFTKWGQIDRQPMGNIRKATARQMDIAWSNIPHVTQFDKADITDLEQLRQRFGKKVEEAGGKLTVTAILLKVVAGALKEFPKFNASLDAAKEEIVYKHYYHIGVAVDTDRGLLVPVIRDVDQKNIMQLSAELTEVAEKARSKKLSLEDMQGGTFTITNLGGIGGTNFTPIVNSPQVAILGVAHGGTEPVYRNGQFEPRQMLPLSLSYDHRLIDGADGARFLRWIVQYLEQPFLTALQGW